MNSTFIQRIAHHITEKYNLRQQSLTIVFPNKRAAFHLREAFKAIVKGNIWLPQMCSIEEAVSQWSGYTLADNMDILFELIDIYAGLHPEKVKDGNDLRIFGSQAAQMARDFDEIDQYDVNAEDLFNLVFADKELQVWDFDVNKRTEKEIKYLHFFKSLLDYYNQLRIRLKDKNLGYYGMITRHLAHLDDNAWTQAIGNQKILFAGFNALTRTEEAIIDALIRSGKAEIIFDYDSYYLDDPTNEAGLFGRRYKAKHDNWMTNSTSNRLMNEAKHIHLIAASGNAIQCKALQNKLQETNTRNTTVVLSDENLLIPVLNAIPDIPNYSEIKVSMGYPIRQTPVNHFIIAFLALHNGRKIKRDILRDKQKKTITGWYLWPLLRLMKLELTKTIFTQDENHAFEKWERQALRQGTFIFEDSTLEAFEPYPQLKGFLAILTQDNEGPEDLVASLRSLLHFVAQNILSSDPSREMLFLLNQVSESGKIINRLEQIIQRHGDFVTDKESISILYSLVSRNKSVKLNSNSTDGLQIMGLLETRNLYFDNIHVLSVNEGVIPAEKSQGSFIPSFVKRAFNLPGYREKQAVVAYHFYHLLQSASDIFLYYNNTANQSGGEPSRFILQIVEELAKKNTAIQITEEPFLGQSTQASEVLTLTVNKAPIIETIIKKVCEYGLSPTVISSYIKCPLRFYMERLEQINDKREDEEIGYDVMGSIIHKTFEQLFGAFLNQTIDAALFKLKIKPMASETLSAAIEQALPAGMSDIGFNYLKRLLLDQWIQAYMNYTENRLKDHPFTVLDVERPMKAEFEAGGRVCRILGHVDRIDQVGHSTYIIDYKSGTVMQSDVTLPARNDGESDLEYLKRIPEKAFQLLTYKYLYLKNNPQVQPQQVSAALHCLKHPKKMEYSLVFNQKDADANTFLADEHYIADMEAMLRALVEDIFDTNQAFTQCQSDKKPCSNCLFAEICKRN